MHLKLTDREWGHLFFEEINLEAQLLAVRSLLRRNRDADSALADEIRALEAQARAVEEEHAWIVEDMWAGQLEFSVFHDAANSMAAVGMLAPMFEALFTNLFRTLGRSRAEGKVVSDRASRADEDYWNPHFVFGKTGRRDELVAGILQLSRDTQLHPLLPKDYGAVLTALFAYRNMMFHNGFEWPAERREAFARSIASQKFPKTWFSRSTRGNDVWIHYMSPAFVERCLDLVDEVLSAVGQMTRPPPPAAAPTRRQEA